MNAIASFRLTTLSNEELIKKVDSLTDKMFKEQEVPTRHIPALPNDDYDLLIGELILRLRESQQTAVNFAQHLLKDFSTQEVTLSDLNDFLNIK